MPTGKGRGPRVHSCIRYGSAGTTTCRQCRAAAISRQNAIAHSASGYFKQTKGFRLYAVVIHLFLTYSSSCLPFRLNSKQPAQIALFFFF